jgi:beta-glucanase (GH16 family)
LSNGASATLLAAAVAAIVLVLVSGSSPPTRGRVVDVAVHRTNANSMPAPPGFSHRIFEDSFKGTKLNKRKWNTYITSKGANGSAWNPDGSGGSGANPGGFNAAYFQPREDVVHNGLTLGAVRASTRAGFAWTSGVVSTYGKFQFDGGYVQIKAKMPAGDGMWPGLWMLPGPGGTAGDNFELDLFEGNYIGNAVNPNDNDAWNLHTPSATFGGVTNTGANLAAGYHIYGMNWVPGQSITWYLDGRPVGSLTKAQAPIPNEPMELILDLQVANSSASAWRTTNDASTPSPSAMEVAEVQVYRSPIDRKAAR